jgi:hypothetical protein
MRKYVLTLAVLATVPLSGLAMAADADQANAVLAAGAVQLSDEEMDNVSAAGLGNGKIPPGQQLKLQSLSLSIGCVGPGKSCSAPGHNKLVIQTLGVGGQRPGASGFAPGHNK